MFVKAFNADMTGYGGYPFAIGKEYESKTSDSWNWFHYTDKLTTALNFYAKPDVRFCEVEPLGEIRRFTDTMHGRYYTTNKLCIVREISRKEAFAMLSEEQCPIWRLECLEPPYEVLICYRAQLRGSLCYKVLMHCDLTAEQKESLLPKKYHRYISIFDSA